MNKLRLSGNFSALNPSASVDIARQVTDKLYALYNNISQLVSEYNTQVYPVVSTLPQGVKDTRWSLDDTINPRVNGLDGANMMVDIDATSTTNSGRFWNTTRPKTIKEAFTDLYTEISAVVDALRTEFSNISSSGLSTTVQERIGMNIFDETQVSSPTSLDGLTNTSRLNILQLAKDLYDESYDSLDGDGNANLTYSVRDHLAALLAIHDGSFDSDLTLNHDGVGGGGGEGVSYSAFAGCLEAETSQTSEVVVGKVYFNPLEYGEVAVQIYFHGISTYEATTPAGSGYLRLYDMGAADDVGIGVLRSTIEVSYTTDNKPVVSSNLLTVVEAAPGTDDILNEGRLYELRIARSMTGSSSDLMHVHWSGFMITPSGGGGE